jgi:DNA-binding response OmpR family regulator
MEGEGRGLKFHVLVVEDDARIADILEKNLVAAGYDVTTSGDGGRALADFARVKPALVVLDLGLPGIDGLEVTRRLRRESTVPILMVTARSSEGDKLLGLEIGADDYIVKPFSTAELVARVRALLRRSSGALGERVIEHGALRIDPARRVVERDGAAVPLTTLEFDLLHFLAQRPGRVFSREALMEHVWGDDRVVDDRSIDSLVSRLRKKLEPDATKPRYVETVWGAGYRLTEARA